MSSSVEAYELIFLIMKKNEEIYGKYEGICGKYEENMKKHEENMKEYSLLYRLWELEKFRVFL